MDRDHCTSVKIHRTYNTKSEPSHKLWALSDMMCSCGFTDSNKETALAWGVDSGGSSAGGNSVLSTQICYKPKTALKNATCFGVFFFRPQHVACRISVLQPGTEPVSSALEAWGHNHWTARKFPTVFWAFCFYFGGALGLSCGIQTLSCHMWDLGPGPGIKPGPAALGVQSLNQWTTRGPPHSLFLSYLIQHQL